MNTIRSSSFLFFFPHKIPTFWNDELLLEAAHFIYLNFQVPQSGGWRVLLSEREFSDSACVKVTQQVFSFLGEFQLVHTDPERHENKKKRLLGVPERELDPTSCLWCGWVPRRDPTLRELAPKVHSRWYRQNEVWPSSLARSPPAIERKRTKNRLKTMKQTTWSPENQTERD